MKTKTNSLHGRGVQRFLAQHGADVTGVIAGCVSDLTNRIRGAVNDRDLAALAAATGQSTPAGGVAPSRVAGSIRALAAFGLRPGGWRELKPPAEKWAAKISGKRAPA